MKTVKVLKLKIADIPSTDAGGNAIADPIGSRITKALGDASLAGFGLVAAYETAVPSEADPSPQAPTHVMLYFQKD